MMRKTLVALLCACTFQSMALEKGDWMLHLRGINVDPNDDSSAIRVDGADVSGTGVKVDAGQSLDISVSYMFSDQWSVQLLADLSSKHSISSVGLGGLGVPDGSNLIGVNTLPPTLFLNYQFRPQAKWRPYAGIGLNYTTFLRDDFTDGAKMALDARDLDLDDSFGLGVQVGLDYQFSEKWFFNVNAKYIDISTEANFVTALGQTSVDVDVDPVVLGVGFGFIF